jgi:hypothetical protein
MPTTFQTKRGHTPSPDKGRVREGFGRIGEELTAVKQTTQSLTRIDLPQTPLDPPLSGGKTGRSGIGAFDMLT